MFEAIKKKLWDLLKEKKVSLAMLYNKDGEIIWHKGREIIGKTIDHGDITILIEYGKKFFGALFIKGNQTSEVRAQLKDFIDRFENQHLNTLKKWTGATAPFKDTDQVVENIFRED